MKKTISILVIISLFIMSFPISFADTDVSSLVYFHNGDEFSPGLNVNPGGSFVGNTYKNDYILFKDVDFSKISAKSIDITYAVSGDSYIGTRLNVCLDSKTNSIGTLYTRDSGDWETFITDNVAFNNPNISGIHNVYFVCQDTPVANLRSFEFKSSYKRVTDPKITMYDKRNRETTDISLAKKLTATSMLDISSTDDLDGWLILCLYDKNGALINKITDYQTEINNKQSNFSVEIPNEADIAHLAAYFIDDKMNFLGVPAYVNKIPTDITLESTNELEIGVNQQNISIYGTMKETTDNTYCVTVYKKDMAESFEDMVQMYSFVTDKQKYQYNFTMNSSLLSGDYTVKIHNAKNEFNISKDFFYYSLNDIYNALEQLRVATNGDEIENTLINNGAILNLKSDLYKEISDKTYINSILLKKISDMFTNSPLISGSSSYDEWLLKLNEIFDLECVLEWLYQTTEPQKTATIMDSYKKVLNLDTNAYFKYFTEEAKVKIASSFIARRTQRLTKTSFNEAFADCVVFAEIENAGGWGNIEDVFNNFGEKIGLDISKYSVINDENARRTICSAFLGKEFKTSSDIISLYNMKITEYYDSLNNPGGGDGGGSSGGSGSGGGVSVKPVPVKETPKEVVTIDTPEPYEETAQTVAKKFNDLSDCAWAENEIELMASKGFVSGKSEGVFAPYDIITREEFVTIVLKTFNVALQDITSQFNDIDINAWYAPYINSAVSLGIINGISDNEFGVGKAITRQEIATILHRASNILNLNLFYINSKVYYTDYYEIAPFAQDAVNALTKGGIISGMGNDKFCPAQSANRAQALLMVYRLYNAQVEE